MSIEAAEAVELRPLRHSDLREAQALSSSFGWPHRLEDWEFMLALGPGLAAEWDGKLVGTALSWPYGDDAAALGLVCVVRSLQGRGLGRRLLTALLSDLEGRVVVLHATEQGLPLYRSLGFAADGQFRQHQGGASQPPLEPLRPGERLRPTGRSDPEMLAALDQEATGMDRRPLIAALLRTGTGVVLDRDGQASGFAVLRRFGHGHVIGPVVAPDRIGARALIGHFLASNPGQFIRVDVPVEGDVSGWLEGLGLSDAGIVVRMVRGRAGRRPAAVSCFALASQAFG